MLQLFKELTHKTEDGFIELPKDGVETVLYWLIKLYPRTRREDGSVAFHSRNQALVYRCLEDAYLRLSKDAWLDSIQGIKEES